MNGLCFSLLVSHWKASPVKQSLVQGSDFTETPLCLQADSSQSGQECEN